MQGKRLTTEEFIEHAKEIHGDKYDYSLANYINNHTKIKIICSEHGIFEQWPSTHLNGANCQKCNAKNKTKTTETFIKEAKIIHNDKYDYSKSEYINNSIKVCIICPIHGEFWQTPNSHLCGIGCKKCGIENHNIKTRSNINDFIEKAKKIHGDKYDYSQVKYINSRTEIDIICPKHGIFKKTPNTHLSGIGCTKCSIENSYKTNEDFINEANKIHNFKYDYSKCFYKHSHEKVKIICPIHGPFSQTASKHLEGYGCRKCSNTHQHTNQEFIEKANEMHHFKYDYSQTNYTNNKNKVKIICKEHGIFLQRPSHHLSGTGCPSCKKSKGENTIINFLIDNNIAYKKEKTFENCRNPKTKYRLKFDFYLIDYNVLIEYDGEQHHKHYKFSKHDKTTLEDIQYRDSIKTKYCKDNDIKLIRIPYWDFKNIEEILKRELNL